MQTRRTVIFAMLAGAALVAFSPFAPLAETARVSVKEAHEKAVSGEVVLLDIRSPGEWKRTGIGAGASPVSMHLPGFMEKLEKLTGGDKARPVALICATGGRSARVQKALAESGYSNVIDVSEGMLGNAQGPGWIRTGLPVTPYTGP